jgi:hypothetical protein
MLVLGLVSPLARSSFVFSAVLNQNRVSGYQEGRLSHLYAATPPTLTRVRLIDKKWSLRRPSVCSLFRTRTLEMELYPHTSRSLRMQECLMIRTIVPPRG